MGNNKTSLKQRRIFSVEVRKGVVRDIEHGKCSVLQASRELQVNQQTIYNWLYKYSLHLQKGKITVVQKQSEEYRTKELEKRIVELEAALGRKQMELDLLNKVLDLASEDLKIDLKKNLSGKPSSGSGTKKE